MQKVVARFVAQRGVAVGDRLFALVQNEWYRGAVCCYVVRFDQFNLECLRVYACIYVLCGGVFSTIKEPLRRC